MGKLPRSAVCGLRFVAFVIIAGIAAPGAVSQEAPGPEPVSREAVTAALERIEADNDLEPELKQRLIDYYEQAAAHIQTRDEWNANVREFEAARSSAPQLLDEAERALLEGLNPPPIAAFQDRPADEIQDALTEWELTKTRAQEEAAQLETEPARRLERRRQIPDLRTIARERLQNATAALSAPEVTGDTPELTRARRVAAQANVEAIEAELRSYDAEISSYDARSRLLTLRLDAANRRLAEADDVVTALRDLLATRQQEEARQAAIEARRRLLQISNPPAGIRALASELDETNLELVRRRSGSNGLVNILRRASERLDDLKAEIVDLQKHQELTTAKVEVAQRSAVIGQLLLIELARLPSERSIQREVRARTQEIGETQLEQIELTQRRAQLNNINALVESQLNELAPQASDDQRAAMAEALREAYAANRRAFDALIEDYDTYLTRLAELNANQEELARVAESFRLFIQEHILWTRSSTPINRNTVAHTIPAFVALFDYDGLIAIPVGFWDDAKYYPLLYVVIVLLGVGLIAGRRRFKSQIVSIGIEANRPSQTNQWLTFRALFYSILYAIALPLPIVLLTYRAASPYVVIPPSADALCYGLFEGALVWAVLEMVRISLIPQGVCLSHFRWGDQDCAIARRNLKLFMSIGLPLYALFVAFERLGETDFYHSAGRFIFLALLLLVLLLARNLFRPDNPVVLRIFRTFWDNRAMRAERFWYVIAMLTPVAFGAAAGIGYFYSAVQLYEKVSLTLILFYLILIAGGMAVRWSLLERRRITVEQWKKKYSGKDSESENEPAMDLVKVDTQITRMLRFVFLFSVAAVVYFVWSDTLPALGVLDNVELWRTSETITTTEVGPDGTASTASEVRVVNVTLRHVFIGLVIVIVTAIAVRDLPGFLELAVLQRTALGTGERYAITSITSYGLAVVGIAVALNEIGLGWSRLQWLVAALGLGLGFGLQEIFANFVSGLILLFERPIRVGDVVTVGDVTGRVSRINIRATWITNFNRRDLVVPNKEFVTGQLVNWTLSDNVLRVEVPVGIAYGSDVRKAKELILKCAKECPLALKEPPPEVFFFSFGDNSLGLELRVFSPNIENYLRIKDHMHQAIDDAFRDAGIEIAFPQRDIHIRSISGPNPLVQESRGGDARESISS